MTPWVLWFIWDIISTYFKPLSSTRNATCISGFSYHLQENLWGWCLPLFISNPTTVKRIPQKRSPWLHPRKTYPPKKKPLTAQSIVFFTSSGTVHNDSFCLTFPTYLSFRTTKMSHVSGCQDDWGDPTQVLIQACHRVSLSPDFQYLFFLEISFSPPYIVFSCAILLTCVCQVIF